MIKREALQTEEVYSLEPVSSTLLRPQTLLVLSGIYDHLTEIRNVPLLKLLDMSQSDVQTQGVSKLSIDLGQNCVVGACAIHRDHRRYTSTWWSSPKQCYSEHSSNEYVWKHRRTRSWGQSSFDYKTKMPSHCGQETALTLSLMLRPEGRHPPAKEILHLSQDDEP